MGESQADFGRGGLAKIWWFGGEFREKLAGIAEGVSVLPAWGGWGWLQGQEKLSGKVGGGPGSFYGRLNKAG